MCPILLGINIPIASTIIHAIAAIAIGNIIPKAQTFIKGLIIVSAPIIPIIAPEAPKEEG